MGNKLQFKTNIHCNGCIRSVTGFINEVPGIEHWEVDLENPDKILTVEGNVTTQAIMDAVQEAGFDINPDCDPPFTGLHRSEAASAEKK